MHVVSSGGGKRTTYGNTKSSKQQSSSSGGGGGGGGGGGEGSNSKANSGTVYRIGNKKFTFDGKDGKTLDDVIEELVATSASDRNWKGMFIATIVILAVLGLIVLSVILLTPPQDQRPTGRKISFGDFLSGNLSGNHFNGTWISDNEIVFLDEYKCIMSLEISSWRRTVLVPNTTYVNLGVSVFQVSGDRKYVYLGHDYFKHFRHSFWAKYTIFEIDTGSLIRVTDTPNPVVQGNDLPNDGSPHPHLQYLGWAPKGNAYVFVYKNNLYYRPSVHSPSVFPLSSDGVPNVISNGVPDWVYEEEILSQNNAVWFAPSAQKLAYIRFNDTRVEEVSLPLYEPSPTTSYPRYGPLRYPKAGTRNPEVTLKVVDMKELDNERVYELHPPSVIRKSDHYLVNVKWINDEVLSTIWMNRNQNLSMVAHCYQSKLWACVETYTETARSRGWVNLYSMPIYHPDGKEEFLVRSPVLDGSHGPFLHILNVQYGHSSIQQPLTHGKFEVVKIFGWDPTREYIYYSATPNGESSNLHLYRLRRIFNQSSDSFISGHPECVSCPLVKMINQTETELSLLLRNHVIGKNSKNVPLPQVLTPSGCLYNDASFSPDMRYFVLDCRGPDIPQTLLYRTKNLSQLAILNDNSELRAKTVNMTMPKIRTFTVPTSSGYTASVKVFLPPEITVFTFSSYPLIVEVYAGPGSKAVTSHWKHGWASYLASSRGWIVAMIDGRGSGRDGNERRFEVHEKLGTVEVDDQIEVTKYLVDNLHIIDPRRIAIWGWSYGGFVTLHALSDLRQELFQCGIAVAPVTNWRFYDSVYSERYMGTPGIEGNFKGYDESDIMSRAHNFRPTAKTLRKLFLVHGTRDDNVHLQNSMVLAKALVREGINFKQQIYTDATHNLRSVRPHFYLAMESFLDACFMDVSKEALTPVA